MTAHETTTSEALPIGTWSVDPSQTTITVTARKLGLFAVPATLSVSAGTIEIGADREVSAVEVTADAGSYESRMAKRNDHVRSADFLDADSHPQLVFRTDRVSAAPGGYRADGSVTVKTGKYPLTVYITSVEFDERRGSFEATATIDRKAIGLGKFPSFFIGRNVQVSVSATALVTES